MKCGWVGVLGVPAAATRWTGGYNFFYCFSNSMPCWLDMSVCALEELIVA